MFAKKCSLLVNEQGCPKVFEASLRGQGCQTKF